MYLLILATYLKGKLTKKRSDTESMQASTHWFVVVNKTSRNSLCHSTWVLRTQVLGTPSSAWAHTRRRPGAKQSTRNTSQHSDMGSWHHRLQLNSLRQHQSPHTPQQFVSSAPLAFPRPAAHCGLITPSTWLLSWRNTKASTQTKAQQRKTITINNFFQSLPRDK